MAGSVVAILPQRWVGSASASKAAGPSPPPRRRAPTPQRGAAAPPVRDRAAGRLPSHGCAIARQRGACSPVSSISAGRSPPGRHRTRLGTRSLALVHGRRASSSNSGSARPSSRCMWRSRPPHGTPCLSSSSGLPAPTRSRPARKLRSRPGVAAPPRWRYATRMAKLKKGSAVEAFLSDLTAGLAVLPEPEQERVLSAGRHLVAVRRALLSKPQRRASARSATRDRIRVAG